MFTTCCGLLTVQVGVTVLAAVFLTLAAVILVANIFESSSESVSEEPARDEGGDSDEGDESGEGKVLGYNYNIAFVVIFAMGLLIVGLLAFFSAYQESVCCAFIALLFLIVLTTFWIVLSVLSFMGKPPSREAVCHELKCPESLWLAKITNDSESGNNQSIQAKYMFQNLKVKDMVKPPNLTGKIHQILVKLQSLKSLLEDYKNCYKRNKISTNLSYSDSSKFIGEVKKHLNIMNESNIPNGILREINKLQKLKLHWRQNHSKILPKDFHENLSKLLVLSDSDDTEKSIKLGMEGKQVTKKPKSTKHHKGSQGGEDGKGGGKGLLSSFLVRVLLFIINLIFFLYSALMLWSWSQELNSFVWDYYY